MRPSTFMSGSPHRRRSASSASGTRPRESEDGPCAIHDRARVAGGIHGQAASGAQRAARGEHRLSLLGEVDDLLGTEPEADAGDVVCLRWLLLAGSRFARDQHEHVAAFVVSQADLPDLPLRLARFGARVAWGFLLGALDALLLQHLVQPDDQGLDLRLVAAERHGAPRAGGQEEELALAGLSDRRHGDLVARVELEYGHELSVGEPRLF